VVFVSHQMQAVANLCHMAMELQHGRTVNWGPAREVVNRYLSAETSNSSSCTWSLETAPGDDIIRLLGVRVEDQQAQSPAVYRSDEPIQILIEFECFETPSSLQVGFDLFLPDGTHVLRTCQTDLHQPSFTIGLGRNRLRCEIPPGLLNGCCYFVAPWASLHNIKWCYRERPVVQFQVSLSHGESAFWHGLTAVSRGGVISPIFQWNSA
jgi:lipopolysaccharide transport system ATP-binding protein